MKYHLILSRAQWANENKSLWYQTTQALFLERSMGGGGGGEGVSDNNNIIIIIIYYLLGAK